MRATVGECHRRMQNNSKYSPTGVWWVKTSVVLINYRYCRIGGNFLTLKLHLKRIPNVWFDWIFKKKKKRKIFTHAWTSKFRFNMIVAQIRLPAFWRHIGVEKFNFCLKVRLALLFPNYQQLPEVARSRYQHRARVPVGILTELRGRNIAVVFYNTHPLLMYLRTLYPDRGVVLIVHS